MAEDHVDHDVDEIIETSGQQSNENTSDAVRHAAFGNNGEELIKDDNPNDQGDQRCPSRPVQRREQHKRLGNTTIPGQYANPMNASSTSDAARQAVFGNIDHEKLTDFGSHEEDAFSTGEEFEDCNPIDQERYSKVQTREQHRRLGNTPIPGQHANRMNESSTLDAVHQAAFGNIGHEKSTDFGGHEEDAFSTGEEFEDRNPIDQERYSKVQTRGQHQRLGNTTIPSQHANRMNESSTSDAVRQAAFGNIGHEKSTNFGDHEEDAFSTGEEFEDRNPFDQERYSKVQTREQHQRLGNTTIPGQHANQMNESSTSDAVRQAAFGNIGHEKSTDFGGHEEDAFSIGEEFEDHTPIDQERYSKVQTREQHRKLGKDIPEQSSFGNIGHHEEVATDFGINIGHEAAVAFDNVNEEKVAFSNGGEKNDYPNEERHPRVQMCDQSRKSGTIVPEHTIRINDNERRKPIIISGSGWSTLKVPVPMFKVDDEAYVPKIVSIGPFHCNVPSLRAMQTQKRRFLDRLIRNQTGQTILEESLKTAMRELEEKTRDFYAKDFQAIKSNEFVHMMLLDGCFIVELMRLYEKKCRGEPIFETRWMLPNITRDLLLLENQLPMFVLQKISELTTLKGEACPNLNTLALGFFEPLRLGKDKFETNTLEKHAYGEYIHLLALFHSALTLGIDRHMQQPENSGKTQLTSLPGKGWVHNAKTLNYAGIQFKNNSSSVLDNIELKGKTLMIPTMIIHDGTGPLLRNLIAYEQNNRDATPYFCCLAVFLNSIVDTVEDVKILREAGIIKQDKGGDDEVARLFNSLTKELVFDIDEEYCYMTKQIENINRLCRAHDMRVRIFRLLSRLNYKGLLTTYASILVTVIFSLIAAKFASYKPSVNEYYSPRPSPAPRRRP